MTGMIPQFLGFIALAGILDDDNYDVVAYCPAHLHTPGSDIPCSSSWLMVL